MTATTPIRLTAFSHGAGCACKLSPTDLRTVLGLVRGLGDAPTDPNLLVGLDTSDDAAVYRLRDDLAIVVTTDFFTPIVDDPYDWGRIAATNALSDVYAMGGAPLLALNIVAWPREGLPFELLARVLDGGKDVVCAAGALIGGGHSIDDAEPKFGLAVVGTVDPARVFTNRDARAVPVIDGVRALLADGMVAGGTQRNHAFVDDSVDWNGLALDEQLLLADAQTSGGLLLAVAPDAADALVRELDARGALASAVVGYARAGDPGTISVRG